jgi:outer membrane lipoprotein-sorting protein
MSQLGDFLEILCGPAETFRTIQATLRHWRNDDAAAKADAARASTGGRPKQPSPTEKARIAETRLRVWLSGADKVRVETERQSESGAETTIEVIDGSRRTQRDPEGHVESEELHHPKQRGITASDRHFDLSQIREFVKGLALQFDGTVKTAGRDCIRIRATKRSGERLWPHWLPSQAEEYEFHADRERAVLLSIYSKVNGETFEIYEVENIIFDSSLDPALFSYTPELGEQVRPAIPVTEQMSLEAAVARLPFRILIPTRGIDFDRAHLHTFYHPSRKGSDRPYFSIMYFLHHSHSLWIHESQFPDPSFDHYEWERLEIEGQTLWLSDPGQAGGDRIIYLAHDGTYITIHTSLLRKQAIDLALSLEPASGHPSKARSS